MSNTILLDETVIPITITYLEEDQVYQVSCPWFQGCHAWGKTLDDALRIIPGNIRAMIKVYQDKGTPLPPELEHLDLQNPFSLRMVPA